MKLLQMSSAVLLLCLLSIAYAVLNPTDTRPKSWKQAFKAEEPHVREVRKLWRKCMAIKSKPVGSLSTLDHEFLDGHGYECSLTQHDFEVWLPPEPPLDRLIEKLKSD